eukprot:302942_1
MGCSTSLQQDVNLTTKKITNQCYPITADKIKCHRVCRLISQLQQYSHGCIDININIDDFLHSIDTHNDIEQFEYIYNSLGFCDGRHCDILTRRNTSDYMSHSSNSNAKKNARFAIICKIHCYYQHCFDVGNKLSIREIRHMQHFCNEDDYECKSFNKYLINTQISMMNKILLSKKEQYKNVNNILHQRLMQRYHQMIPDSKSLDESLDDDSNNMYSFGFQFNYGCEFESDDFENPWDRTKTLYFPDPKIVHVSAKYRSLKEESLSNNISVMLLQQFEIEYQKAKIHFNSFYRKQKLPVFKIQYILSIMIYCNYTQLQYEFSKTYRENNGKNHKEF